MSDEAIRAAVAKLDELNARIVSFEQKIAKAKQQLSETKRFIAQWEKFSGRPAPIHVNGQGLETKGHPDPSSAVNVARHAAVNPKKEDVTKAAQIILQGVSRPVSRSELNALLAEVGVVIRGANPEMVLSTMLWRTKDWSGITRLKSGGYCLSQNANPNDIDDNEGPDDNEDVD